MYEKLNILRKICGFVGITAFLIYIIVFLCTINSDSSIMIRIIVATIALTAFSIECGAEISSNESARTSTLMIAVSIGDIIIAALALV